MLSNSLNTKIDFYPLPSYDLVTDEVTSLYYVIFSSSIELLNETLQ